MTSALQEVANDLVLAIDTLPANTSGGSRALFELHVRRLKSLAAGFTIEESSPDPEVVASLAGASKRTIKVIAAAAVFVGLTASTGFLETAGGSAWDRVAEKLGVMDSTLTKLHDDAIRSAQVDRDRLLTNALGQIDPRSAEIVKLRWGLDRGEPRTLKEVGSTFNVTPQRIRQIEARAIHNLDKVLAAEGSPVTSVELLSSTVRKVRP